MTLTYVSDSVSCFASFVTEFVWRDTKNRIYLYTVTGVSCVKAYDLRSSGGMKFMFYGQRHYLPFD